MSSESFLALAIRELRRLHRLADDALAQVGDHDFVRPLGDDENSLAIVVKHLAGNMRSRWTDFLTSDGEKPDRDRDGELELDAGDSRSDLAARWAAGWQTLFDAIEPLGEDDLARTVTIRGEGLSVLQAIGRQLTHYAYHVGQIVLLARHWAGDDWQSLSVPKGRSRAFNQAPAPYLDDPPA